MKPYGIPTCYLGRQYRSRLEARWAAFFGLLGWDFEYEPFDLQGWIPDFILPKAKVLVEVKPVTERPEEIVVEIDRCRGAEPYEILIVGCVVPVADRGGVDASDGAPIGWMRGKPEFWNERAGMKPVWGIGLIQKFHLEWPGFDIVEDQIQDMGFGLFSSRDHILYADEGFTLPDDRLGDLARNRLKGIGGLTWWGTGIERSHGGDMVCHSEIISLWNKAGNLVQWKGKQSRAT